MDPIHSPCLPILPFPFHQYYQISSLSLAYFVPGFKVLWLGTSSLNRLGNSWIKRRPPALPIGTETLITITDIYKIYKYTLHTLMPRFLRVQLKTAIGFNCHWERRPLFSNRKSQLCWGVQLSTIHLVTGRSKENDVTRYATNVVGWTATLSYCWNLFWQKDWPGLATFSLP